MNTLRAIMAVSLLAVVANTAMADEFLLNPGFESGALDPWQAVPFQGGTPSGMDWMMYDNDPAAGDYAAMGFSNEAMLLQEIQPVYAADILDFSLQAKQERPWGAEDLELGVVCRFADPTGVEPYIEGVKWYAGDFLQWRSVDGLFALDYLAALVEGAGPNGPQLIAVGLVGKADTVTYCDSWTLTAVPEPASIALLAFGGIGLVRRRRF